MRWGAWRRAMVCGCSALIAVSAVVVGSVAPGAAATRATHTVSSLDSCDVTTVEDPFVDLGDPLNYPGNEYCGVEALENDAYDMFVQAHALPSGSPVVIQVGQSAIEGIFWQLLQEVAYESANNPSALSADEVGAYQWLEELVQAYQTTAAQDAINEYNKWHTSPCTYLPPAKLFTFVGDDDPACSGTEASLFAGPAPPTYAQLLEYGLFEAGQDFGVGPTSGTGPYANVDNEAFDESSASWGSLLLAAGPKVFNAAVPGSDGFVNVVDDIFPHAKIEIEKRVQNDTHVTEQKLEEVDAAEEEAQLSEEGEPEDDLISDSAETVDEVAPELGTDVAEATADFGAEILGGTFFIAGIGLAILVQEAVSVIQQALIPGQLQANLNGVAPDPASYIESLLSDNGGGGSMLVQQMLQNQMVRAVPESVPTAPFDGTELQVSLVNAQGIGIQTEVLPSVNLASWPLGIDQGALGTGFETVSVADGMFWHTPSADDRAAGLSGVLPATELHYYNWNGGPELAFLDGNQFITLPSPGSSDLGGFDAENGCGEGSCDGGATCGAGGGCSVTNVLEALLPGAAVIPGYTLSDLTLNGDAQYFVSTGKLQPGGVKIRLSIKPDPGTAPALDVVNQYGNLANVIQTGPPNGGLVAGQSVTMRDDQSNPEGFATTYTWQIETRCAYDPAHPVQTIQGVPVCFGSPDYGHSTLAPNEQNLTSGCPSACTEDPAFHGHPVETLTNQSVPYTWPAPGTYHIRLITDDTYGKNRQADEDFVVVGPNPQVSLSTSPPFSGAAAIGPLHNGGTATINGCIASPDDAYANPQATISWGDGSPSDTGTGQSGGAGNLQFHFGTTASCNSLWSYTATHTYNLTPTGAVQAQRPISITTADGFGKSITTNLGINIDFSAPPTITSPPSTIFHAGTTGNFTVVTTGVPAPHLSLTAGSVPPGLGFDDLGNGTGLISGDPSLTEGGVYPLTLTATNDSGSISQSFTLNIQVEPQFTSAASTTFTAGANGTFTITASGTPRPNILVAGQLPTGVHAVVNANGSVTLSGTPAAGSVGNYPLSVGATSFGGQADQQFVLTVASVPTITSASTFGFVSGGSPVSFPITTAGSPAPALTLAGPLPTGVLFHDNGDGTAELFGSTSDSGTFPVTVTATNVAGTATQALTVNASSTGGAAITFSGPNYSTPDAAAEFTVGSAGSATITSSEPGDALHLSGTLPDGLSFTDNGDGTATVSGTPAAGSSGKGGVVLTSTSGGLAFLTVTVFGPPVVTSQDAAAFTVGAAGTFTVATNADPQAALSTADALPDGLSFVDNGDGTATVSGTPGPGTAGTYPITIEAESLLATIFDTLTVTIDQVPAITSPATAGFGHGQTKTFTVTTTGSPTPSLTEVGHLPNGVTFIDNGDGTASLAGKPTGTGTASYPVTINAASTAGLASQSLVIEVGPRPTITSVAATTLTVGTDGAFTVQGVGIPTPSLALAGPLPSGLVFTDNGDGSGTLAGTPAPGSGGLVTLTLTATNLYGSVTQALTVTVDEAPALLGSSFDGDCSGPDPESTAQFIAGTPTSWTLCTSGTPRASLNVVGLLPAGVSFKDNGNGSATLSGNVLPPGGTFPLTLEMSNAAGVMSAPLTLTVGARVQSTSAPDAPTFVAGQPNSYQLSASGSPTPSFSVLGGPPPAWLSLIDHGDGTATLSGTPPADAAGTEVGVPVLEANGIPNGFVDFVNISIASLGFTTSSPPSPQVGVPYSYAFTATDPGATFAMADGGRLPAGLTLSTAGVLSGTPTTEGSAQFQVVATDGADSATTAPIVVSVSAAPHQFEITQFRLFGPGGGDDWYAKITNTTAVDVPLVGWKLGLALSGVTNLVKVTLGSKTLSPGSSVIVAGPFFTGALKVAVVGPPLPASPGGFEILSPSGVVVDRVGEVGANPALIAGTGLPVPPLATSPEQFAFIRLTSGGVPVDTDNNSADFVYRKAPFAGTRPVVTAVTPATGPLAGGTSITITGTGFVPGAQVEIGQGTGPGATAIAATDVNVVSSTEITATTGATTRVGKGDVYVITSAGNNATAGDPQFRYS